jgi:hypothetical protein
MCVDIETLVDVHAWRALGGCDLPARAPHRARRAGSSQGATAPEACVNIFPERILRTWLSEQRHARRRYLDWRLGVRTF